MSNSRRLSVISVTSVAVAAATVVTASSSVWLKVGFLGILEVLGNGASDVSINFWLRSFRVGAADFTVLLMSAMFYAMMIVPVCLGLWAHKLHHHRSHSDVSLHQQQVSPLALLRSFFGNRWNMFWLAAVTFCDLSINIFGTYAAGHIPVIIQVILKAAEPLLCWLLSCFVWRGAYSQRSLLLVALPTAAMVAAAGGVVAETWFALQVNKDKSNVTFWVVMYIIRVAASAAYNVAQGTLMRRNRALFCGVSTAEGCGGGSSAEGHVVLQSDEEMPRQTSSNALLLSSTILALDAFVSLIVLVAVGPFLDTIAYAGWGSSHSVADAWVNFSSGVSCVFSLSECQNNLWFALITNGAWVVVYVVDTFLNEASPALNSLMNMLSSPLTTVVLVLFPALDLGASVRRDTSSVLLQCGGIALMLTSVVLFYKYERCKQRKQTTVTTIVDSSVEIASSSDPLLEVSECPRDVVGDERRIGVINE
jgi:hypothetical protein